MANPRTPSRWPYQNTPPARGRRVVKQRDDAPRGVQRREPGPPVWSITPGQARLMLAGALLAVIGVLGAWAYQSPYFTVQEVEVSGVSRLTPEQVIAVADIEGESAFRLDVDAAEARVASMPQVRSVKIEQQGFSGATISIEERTPWGSWQINGTNVPIDIDGYVLSDVVPPEGAPVIVEAQPEGVLNAGDRLDAGAVMLADRLLRESDTALGRQVMALIYRRSAGLTVVFSPRDVDGETLWVTFGDSRDYEYKVASLYVLLEQAIENKVSLKAVDLRFGERLSFN